jgi:hypothetical protein
MMGWGTLAITLGKHAFSWLRGEQKRKEAKQEIKAQWEVAQTQKYPWFVSVLAAAHIIVPIDYALYLSIRSAWPIESPEELQNTIQSALNAFPSWWTGFFITTLGVMLGIHVNGQSKINQSEARKREQEAERKKNVAAALKAREERKRAESMPERGGR